MSHLGTKTAALWPPALLSGMSCMFGIAFVQKKNKSKKVPLLKKNPCLDAQGEFSWFGIFSSAVVTLDSAIFPDRKANRKPCNLADRGTPPPPSPANPHHHP